MTKPELLEALESAERDIAAFFAGLSPDDLTRRAGEAWTPAEHLDHLNITNAAVARGFHAPRWFLALRYGVTGRQSRAFEALRDDYRARLAAGARAPAAFVPPRAAASRADLLARWARVNTRLRAGLERWPERALDRIRLPHPILGTITAREMVFFAVYHAGHHVEAARRRLGHPA